MPHQAFFTEGCRAHQLYNDAIEARCFDLHNVLVVALGENRYLTVQTVETLVFTELSCPASLNLQYFNCDLLLCLQVLSQFNPSAVTSEI